MTNGQILSRISEERGVPLRTLADVQRDLTRASKRKADVALARAMLRHGRLTDEARAWVALEYSARIATNYPND